MGRHTARHVIAAVGQALGDRADVIEAHSRAQAVAALLVVLDQLRELAVVQTAGWYIVRYATVGVWEREENRIRTALVFSEAAT